MHSVKRALVVGIDHYPSDPLSGCVNDAVAIADMLEKNGDGAPNFSVRRLTSNTEKVTSEKLHIAVVELFKAEADTVLLFFAGHGIVNNDTNAGFIVCQDGKKPNWGMSLTEITQLANKAHPKIKSTVIILDSCQSGYAGEVAGLGTEGVGAVGNGVTIMTACHRDGTAAEEHGHGLFSSLLLEALNGSAADVCGRITPASVYGLIDQTLGSWEQRPIYKANVQTFITLRQVSPKISLDTLRRLPLYFPHVNYVFPLNPSYEPDRTNMPDAIRAHFPEDKSKQIVFRELQACNRHGLVSPVGTDHMYFAAMRSTGCKLTASGSHYRKLAELKRI